MATHSSVLAWRIPRTQGPGGIQSIGLQRVRHDWVTNTQREKKKTFCLREWCMFSHIINCERRIRLNWSLCKWWVTKNYGGFCPRPKVTEMMWCWNLTILRMRSGYSLWVCVQPCPTLCDPVDCSPPSLSMWLSPQEHQSGLPFPPPGDLPNPKIKPVSLTSPALAGRFFTTELRGKSWNVRWGRSPVLVSPKGAGVKGFYSEFTG